jgi:hypothetical protein
VSPIASQMRPGEDLGLRMAGRGHVTWYAWHYFESVVTDSNFWREPLGAAMLFQIQVEIRMQKDGLLWKHVQEPEPSPHES